MTVAPALAPLDYASLAQAGLQRLRAYDPGHDIIALRRRFGDALLELGGNESPYGPSPAVGEAIAAELPRLPRYPDPLGGDLKRALAAHHGVEPAAILLGNGSHELLMQFAQAFSGPGREVVVSRYCFAVYALAATAAGAALRIAEPFARDHATSPHGHDPQALATSVTPAASLLYLANPNNPTGTWLTGDALEAMLTTLPSHLLAVVDEAYAEYVVDPAWRSAIPLLPRFPNLIVTRTFSKAYGLAALRVGCAFAHPALIAVMERLRESFNVNALGLAAATAALGDQAHVARVRARNLEQRDALAAALRGRGRFVIPSQTNFLLAEFGPRTTGIEAALVARGAVSRPMGGYGLPDCLRISVGDADESRRLLRALDEVGA